MSDTSTSTVESSRSEPRTSTTENASSGNARPAVAPAPQQREKRPVEVTSVTHGSVIATPVRPAGQEVRTVRVTAEPARSFTAHQQRMLDNMDAHGSFSGTADATTTSSSSSSDAPATTGAASMPAPDAAPAATAVATPAPAPAGSPDPELSARVERLTEHNRRLVAELDKRRTGADPDERIQTLDQIERSATTDPLGAFRRLVALNAGIKDPAAPEVDRLMRDAYLQWTADEIKMPLDAGRQALIGTERNRLLMERDKREAAATAAKAKAETDAKAEQERDAGYDRDLDAVLARDKHAEKYPLMMKHAQRIDGMTPGALLRAVVKRGVAAGEVPETMSGPDLTAHYSKLIETHYQDHLAHLGVAPSSTATQAPAIVPTTDSTAGATSQGARTITNASASVAPPAPPAATPPASNDKPRRVSEETRRRQLAEKHFGS